MKLKEYEIESVIEDLKSNSKSIQLRPAKAKTEIDKAKIVHLMLPCDTKYETYIMSSSGDIFELSKLKEIIEVLEKFDNERKGKEKLIYNQTEVI